MWWSEKSINMFEGPPFRLSEYMSGQRFHNIGTAIRYTNIESPTFLDRFHGVRQIIEGWRLNISVAYSSMFGWDVTSLWHVLRGLKKNVVVGEVYKHV